MSHESRVPVRAWVVVIAGTSVNLCLGILYAWSVWKANLKATKEHPAGTAISGIYQGWVYLSDAQATWAYAICGFVFALFMIPGGKILDRYGPKFGATVGGLFLASGCILAGLMKSYVGLILGFGLLGGIGMGLGYAAATPAAVRWFGPHRRGLIVGVVVGGYGGAAIYISPLARYLIGAYGLSGSFIGLGILFAVVVIIAGQLLSWPPTGYTAPPAPQHNPINRNVSSTDWTIPQMLRTWHFYALVFLVIGSAQSGLLIIANATPILNTTASSVPFFASNAWLLAAYGGFVNATGRVGTGLYSDRIGRQRAYSINAFIAAVCMFVTPSIIESRNIGLLFLVIGIAYWQYGGGLALLPAFTADFFGANNLGLKYGLVFLGWGIAFSVPLLAGYIEDIYKTLDIAFYLSGALLIMAIVVNVVSRPPQTKNSAA